MPHNNSPIPENVTFSDFDMGFNPHPTTGDIGRNLNVDAVRNSLRNLLLTNRYERPHQPLVGSNLRRILFENFTPQTSLLAKEYVEELIDNFEPRVYLHNIIVNPNVPYGALGIQIVFSIINTNEPITLDVVLDRIA